jgi:hypothetical protein
MLNRHDGSLVVPAPRKRGKTCLAVVVLTVCGIFYLGEISTTSSIKRAQKSYLFDRVQVALPASIRSFPATFSAKNAAVGSSHFQGGSNASTVDAIQQQQQPPATAVLLAETNHTTSGEDTASDVVPLARSAINNSSLNNAQVLPPSNKKSIRDMNWIIPIADLKTNCYRRAQFQLGKVNNEFLRDVRKAQDQMTSNYYFRSSCARKRAKKVIKECYGLGGTLSSVARYILRWIQMNQVLHRLDVFTCTWFQNDKTKTCTTMFGDCYFPAVETYVQIGNDTNCESFGWFFSKYGEYALYAVIMSWMFGGLTLLDTHNNASAPLVEPPEPCIAIHVRRGDACIMKDRKCLEYDAYLQVVQLFVDRYPHLNRLVVLTDAHDFPLERFQAIIPNISYATQYNRSRYNVEHLRNESYAVTAPEHRNMENATSELLSELAEGSQCTALIGTFSAAVSKILFNLMLIRQGRVPLHYSLHGCGNNIWYAGRDSDAGCEKQIIQPSTILG